KLNTLAMKGPTNIIPIKPITTDGIPLLIKNLLMVFYLWL
ncbi:unnamed protein product, partial [marine sediment metagenome]